MLLVFGGGLLLCLLLLGLGRFSRLPSLLICDTLLGLLYRCLLGRSFLLLPRGVVVPSVTNEI